MGVSDFHGMLIGDERWYSVADVEKLLNRPRAEVRHIFNEAESRHLSVPGFSTEGAATGDVQITVQKGFAGQPNERRYMREDSVNILRTWYTFTGHSPLVEQTTGQPVNITYQ